MAKLKTIYVCTACGFEHPKMQGKCNNCGEWNTLVEDVIDASPQARVVESFVSSHTGGQPRHLNEIDDIRERRILTPDKEMNRVLGGGIVEGSVVLLGGEPGIGKSTLLLQLALQLSGLKVLYVSGEESEKQIKMRATRIPFDNPSLLLAAETHLERILQFHKDHKPDILIVDSIQTVFSATMESAPGSVSQVRECAQRLMRLAKDTQTPVFLVGHITKDGALAGPKVLEHMVDVVLSFEGERHNSYRIVRTNKNRFGSTLELGIYDMNEQGLREVTNPSEIFLSSADSGLSGVAIAATLEGLRPLLIEAQALVTPLAYGTPQRSATGFDLRRLSMLLAVLEKRCSFKMGQKDVFVNIAGGLRVDDPALDLGLVCAVVSSMLDMPLNRKVVFAAEIGLTGEIRAVSRIEQRIAEAEKLGFEQIFIAESQLKGLEGKFKGLKIKGFSRLEDVFRAVFGGE
ncbi:MAG: DNA repair protein RadA [Bacteroidetes bacterium]|jgi:DNA repair protein RadA/Sms|nr:DNA repair protein RadA [Bacteroidota bacterium]